MTHRFTLEVFFKTKAIGVPPLKTQLKEARIEDERLAEHYLSAGVFSLHLNSEIKTGWTSHTMVDTVIV